MDCQHKYKDVCYCEKDGCECAAFTDGKSDCHWGIDFGNDVCDYLTVITECENCGKEKGK